MERHVPFHLGNLQKGEDPAAAPLQGICVVSTLSKRMTESNSSALSVPRQLMQYASAEGHGFATTKLCLDAATKSKPTSLLQVCCCFPSRRVLWRTDVPATCACVQTCLCNQPAVQCLSKRSMLFVFRFLLQASSLTSALSRYVFF